MSYNYLAGGHTGGIALEERLDASVVTMWGEIDVALRGEAGAALATALERNVPVVIDTSRVTFIDSTGIAFLVQLYTFGTQEGLKVRLLDPPTVVGDVLEMLGVDEVFAEGHRPPYQAGAGVARRAG
ncbi:STAS domain-containing protein [Antribacter sp. KLBMP9083]|uniref:STAS domain-containing protein n=1 Tax=Antribacter soli TaxID=2910976 RepID=A0AA41QH21_9MICO|nr:STAS domain-containing protein [Antribacter soli]MCF4122511.1 STAS domain-containing protein [Antribacter soli]